MKLKTVEIEGKQYAQVDAEGRVLYDNDGAEFAFDAAQTYTKIQDLTGEAKRNREAKETLAAQLKALDGIDPKKYQDALETLKKVDQKQLLDAGEVDKIRAEIEKVYAPQLQEWEGKYKSLAAERDAERLALAFNGSKFIADNLAVPPDMALATFRDRFKIEEGKVRAYDQNGELIYSRKNPGNAADFDEAIGMIVDSYSYKDRILKANNHQGTGGDQGKGGGNVRTMTREQFGALNPAERAKVAQSMGEGKVKMVD